MNVNLNIPFELVDIDAYFNYADVLLDDFFYAEKAISTEGIIGDIWEGIKKAVKWLIEKIGQFISFIINLIKKVFNWIAGLLKSDSTSTSNYKPSKKANIPDKNVVAEGDKKKAESIVNNLNIVANKSGKSSTESLKNTKPEKQLKHPKIPEDFNLQYNPYLIINTINKYVPDKQTFFLKAKIKISKSGEVKYTDNAYLKETLQNFFELQSACESILNDTDGYYQLDGPQQNEVPKLLKDAEIRLRGSFEGVEYASRHIQDFLKKLDQNLSTVKIPKESGSYFGPSPRQLAQAEFKNLITAFKNTIRLSGLDYGEVGDDESMFYEAVSVKDENSDKETDQCKLIIGGMISVLRDILSIYSQMSKPIATSLKTVVIIHKEYAEECERRVKNPNYKRDISHMYFTKTYEVPNDICQCLHRVFDYCELLKYSGDNPYKAMRVGRELQNKTRFNLKTIMFTSASDKRSGGYNAYAMADTKVAIPIMNLNNTKDFGPFFMLGSVMKDMATNMKSPRMLMKDISKMSGHDRAAMIFLHEAKHTYDHSNEKFFASNPLSRELSLNGQRYDPYGASAVEFSADKGAAETYSYFKPIFNKISSWFKKLCEQVLADIKKQGIKMD